MAIAFVQSAKSNIANQSNVTVTWSTAPVEGNLVIVGIVYDSDRTLILPPDETDGWTTRVAEDTLGSDTGGRVVRIDSATVGSGTDTSWFWDINPNDILGVQCIEISGADIDGALKSESVRDATAPVDIDIDGISDPAGEMFYFVFIGCKNFGGAGIVYTNSDSSMTDDGGAESGGGTNFSFHGWYEILNAARPTANLTTNKTNNTGTSQLLGIPVSAAAATVYPPFPNRPSRRVRM